jgi:ribonuclease P protein subunit RPR2
MPKNSEKRIAEERMKELFELALADEREGKSQYANRKYELIYLYSTKYKSKVLKNSKTWVCKKCKQGIYSRGGRVRIKNSTIAISCANCGYIRRIPISRQSSQR